MTSNDMFGVLLRFAARQWPIVATAAVVAALVGFVAAGDVPDTYTATTSVSVDASALSRFTGLTGVEALLTSTRGDDFREAAAERAGVSEEDIGTGLRTYTGGIPIRLYVEYTADAEAEAARVARTTAAFIVEWQEDLAALDLGKQRAIVDETRKTLERLEASMMDSEWEVADLEYKLWNIRRELVTNEAVLLAMEATYSYTDEPSVATVSGMRERLVTTLGAAVVGLFLGLALAVARHHREARRA